jgi:valyl-tRNA synthetase
MISPMPKVHRFDKELIARWEIVKETVSAIRTVKKENQIHIKENIELLIKTSESDFDTGFLTVIIKLCNISDVRFVSGKPDNCASFMVRTKEFCIPLGKGIDTETEKTKILADLDYYKGFLESVMKKLNNDNFVKNAPSTVIELEQKKKTDTELKIKSLEETLKHFSDN